MMKSQKFKTFFYLPLLALAAICISVTGCNGNSSNTNTESSPEGESSIPESSSTIPWDVNYEDYSSPYNIQRPEWTVDYEDYAVGAAPNGFNMTYYSDIYSRGFVWLTDKNTPETELYLVKSDKGANADFSKCQKIEGESVKVTFATSGKVSSEGNVFPSATGSSNSYQLICYSHKAHVENLEKGKAYSYKAGSSTGGYTYGAFVVEQEQPETIRAIQMSDAQTLDPSKLNVWRNTFTKAVETAGNELDTVLYNGDQFDQNMGKVKSSDANKPLRITMHTKALDIIRDYKFNLPYMASSGNHEPSAPYSQYLSADINYAKYAANGCYYSFDYNFAHFVVINSNDNSDSFSTAQINWLKEDLDKASNAKWKIVMLHRAAYSTGDHTNKSQNQTVVKKLTPIFSEKHVDLVLQAHDHTYNKTLPYKWDAAGYTETYNNAEVVNLNPVTETVGDITYDKNPQGTYYVTTGAAGHRCGASESTDGVWAEVVQDGDGWKALDSSYTFLNNKYKIEMGKIKYSNSYEPYDGKDDSKNSFHSDQVYEVGHLATGCVNAQMFGVLDLSETTLNYKVYTVNDSTVKLFDSLDVLKA